MGKTYGGRWETIESLDQGGQAAIYLVKDNKKTTQDPCVLKRILNGRRRSRFVAEVAACKLLSHPNVMPIIDHSALTVEDDSDEKMYLVMPLMRAGSLEKRVKLYESSLDSTIQVAMLLADGLAHAHGKGVIHRDVKPANILFTSENHVPTISDFGICLLRDQARATETGERVGPWAFMAPELEGGGQLEVTPSADVYSLGKVIYYMLSGGVILPRERHSEGQYDIFTGRGGRHILLARLLDRMICVREKRLSAMGDVKNELQRISHWEEKQGTALSTGASATLSSLLASQREALSVGEHNKRVAAEESSRLSKYQVAVSQWVTARIRELVDALNNQGLSLAQILSAEEVARIVEPGSRIPLEGPHSRKFGEPLCSFGLKFAVPTDPFHRQHHLLLNIYKTVEFRLTVGISQAQRREVADQGILFVPYYFADKNWQAFFGNKTALAGVKNQRGQMVIGPKGLIPQFETSQVLAHRTTTGTWPADVDGYKATLDSAMEIFLDRIQRWGKGTFASLE
jgi:serine/threonine protein kinase